MTKDFLDQVLKLTKRGANILKKVKKEHIFRNIAPLIQLHEGIISPHQEQSGGRCRRALQNMFKGDFDRQHELTSVSQRVMLKTRC